MAQEIIDLKKMAKVLETNFKHSMPWMFLFFLLKQNDETYLFHYLISLPVLDIGIDKDNCIVISSNWQGNNGEQFVYREKDNDEKSIDNVLGDTHKQAKDWGDVGQYFKGKLNKSHFGSQFLPLTDDFGREYYNASSRIILRNLKQIDVYKWGFNIATNSPIDAIGIKSKYLKMGLNNDYDYVNSMKDLEIKVRQIIGQPFAIPDDKMDPSSLLYFWNNNISYILDNEMDNILGGDKAKKTSKKVLNVGQKTGQHLLLD